MVAVEQPRADCGHSAGLTQQCGRCLRWCCPECYVPWHALACGACRAEARAAAADPYGGEPATLLRSLLAPPPGLPLDTAGSFSPAPPETRCRGSRARKGSGSHRHPADVRTLAARVADLERRLQELRPGG